MVRLVVQLLVKSAAMFDRVADALDRFAVRLDPHAWTREKVRDTVCYLDYIEELHRHREHAHEFEGESLPL